MSCIAMSDLLSHTHLCARSSVAPPLINTPSFAATPVATITTVGVARPSAHGQAMTSTDTAAQQESAETHQHAQHRFVMM